MIRIKIILPFLKHVLLSLQTTLTLLTPPVALPPVQAVGMASYYGAGEKGMHGHLTASGTLFRPEEQTCASRSIPLGTIIIVEEVTTGAWAYCLVNDRGPYGAIIRERDPAERGWVMMYYKHGMWWTRTPNRLAWSEPKKHRKKPGDWRGILDMSYGTAKALGVDLERGLIEIRVRYSRDQVGPKMARYDLERGLCV